MLVYWLKSGKRDYIGTTMDLQRRLRQRNGDLKGGASCTQGSTWCVHKTVDGFQSWEDCLKFEWALKRCEHDEAAFTALLAKYGVALVESQAYVFWREHGDIALWGFPAAQAWAL